MSLRDDRVSIRHVLEAARKVVASTAHWQRASLDPNELTTLGIIRLLEIVGEASNAISVEFRTLHPEIPWRQMIGLRNRLIHGYFAVDLDIVWDTIQTDLPPLITKLEQLVDTPQDPRTQ
jgi:uncharacterized protein with HEPN domain